MRTSEPDDVPRRAAPIQLPEFAKVMRGYDPNQVTTFLRTALGRIRDLEGQMADLRSELETARSRVGPTGSSDPAGDNDPYEVLSGHVADVVRAFDQDVERIRTQAEAEAKGVIEDAKARAEADWSEVNDRTRAARTEVERMLQDARSDADQIRLDAQASAEETRAEADNALADARAREAERLSELEARRGVVMAEMRSLRDGMLEAAGRLNAELEGDTAIIDVTSAEESAGQAPDERSEFSGRSW